MAEYRMVRSDLRQSAIVPEHLATDIERIVYETDRFVVVSKREGTPADIARDENQRGRSPPRQSRFSRIERALALRCGRSPNS